MVCVAAFIFLCIVSIFSARYRVHLKKAWECLTKRVRLQKCETGFKDDVKNSLLAKVVMWRPGLVKPVGVMIEIAAVLLVVMVVWSLFEVAKGSAALVAFGTCTVARPDACALDSTEMCGIETERIGFFYSLWTLQPHVFMRGWFEDFGEAFRAAPMRFRNWDAINYIPGNASFYRPFDWGNEFALIVLDPGCRVCRDSYLNKLESGFFDRYNTAFVVYVIPGVQGEEFMFRNSQLIARYIEAGRGVVVPGDEYILDWAIVSRLFSGFDEYGRQYQDAFNSSYSAEEAEARLQSWLVEFGFSEEEVEEIVARANSGEVKAALETNQSMVDHQIRTRMIPTSIYGGRRHMGLFRK